VRALITGAAGFVGRHIDAELQARGWETVPADIRATPVSLPYDALDVFRRETEVYDLVVHCAFHVGGRAAIDGEPRLLARNLELDAALFDWAVRTGQRRVLYFSSSAAYPVRFQDGFEDTRPLSEHDIRFDQLDVGMPDARYGWAKLTGEQLAQAARESGLPVTVVRPFSGYGEDQDDTYPFRAIVERARRRDDPFVVWGPGTQVRDWIHIDDVAAGALAVVESGTDEAGQPVHWSRHVDAGAGRAVLPGRPATRRKVTPLPDKPTGVAYRVGDPTQVPPVLARPRSRSKRASVARWR
jgi:nucleoside-diphosphate-sugar epimerase